LKLLRKVLWIGTVASAFALVMASPGLAKAASLTQVSHPPSPLASCSSSDSAQPGQVFLNATVEPQLAVSGGTMIAMWHQDRWSNGGGHGIGLGISSNAGKTWSESTMPWDFCAPGTPSSLSIYFRNSDPWVSFGPDGTAYASALAFNISVPNNGNAVAVATSSDGGATWHGVGPIPGSAFTQFAQSTDKNSTTADPTTAGTAYTVWDTLIEPTDNPDDNPHTAAYTGPAYFSKATTDAKGNVTWSPAKIIINTPNRQQTIGNIIVVDPTTTPHTLYDFTDLITTPNTPFQGTRTTESVAFVKSTDGGSSWSAPQVIAPFNSLGVVDPNTGQPLRVGDGLEEVARDPSNGKLYVTWESSTSYAKNLNQSRSAFDDEILLVSSGDGGSTWTSPTVVHHIAGVPSYTPTVAVNGGRVAVTYYDDRFLQQGQTNVLPTDYWVSFSTDGGASFGNEQRLTSVSFDGMSAPVARGFFLGDYEGLQPSGTGFQALFVKTNCNAPYTSTFCGPASSNLTSTPNTDPTDVFTMPIA
jgi:hypothetical protein